MAQYSSYAEANTITLIMLLDISTIVGGKYLDTSGNGFDADVVTITDTNDGIKLKNDDDLKDYLLSSGIYDMFYDIDGVPIELLLSRIGYIYNNIFFRNTTSIYLFSQPLNGLSLIGTCNNIFGDYDSDAETIISSIGATSELDKRIVDLHIKDLKAINAIQTGFFAFGDPDNSAIKVIYGLVGQSMDQLKYNWINPLDSDTGNRLTRISGDSDPVTPDNLINFNGSVSYTTHFNASLKLSSANHFSYYSVCNLADGDDQNGAYSNNNAYELGCLGTAGSYKGIALAVRRDDASHSVCENTFQNPTKGVQYACENSEGFFLTNKAADNDLKQYKDNVQLGSTVTDAGTSSYYNGDIILGGCSVDGTIATTQRSILPCGYFSIGDKIDSDALSLFTDAVKRLCSSKNHYYFAPEETAMA